jgi:DNA-binding NarL/FixJ family response regulator
LTQSQIRVLCVDDHPLVREGITRKVELQPDMEVVATASTGEEAVTLFCQHRPDVTLMDLQLPTMSGLQAIQAIRAYDGNAKIIVLTMSEGDEDIHRALRAGASTYMLKRTASDDLIGVLRDVYAGARPMPADTAAQLASRETQGVLTNRETMVVELIAKGMRNKEIAAALCITEDTAEVHIRNIFAKLNVRDRTAAAIVALRRGIIHIS